MTNKQKHTSDGIKANGTLFEREHCNGCVFGRMVDDEKTRQNTVIVWCLIAGFLS